MEYILELNKTSKYFGKYKVLDDVSMKIRKGDIYGFIGNNGAGKTTVIKIISGLIFPDSGCIKLFGEEDINKLTLQRNKVGSLIEKPNLYENMTAKENLELIKIYRNIQDETAVDKVLEIVKLNNVLDKKVKNFSLGMKQRLGIAIALISKPQLLILDEPINGLDPIGVKDIRELLIDLNQNYGTTILISSHILSELKQIATRYGFISNGKLIEEISVEELQKKCSNYTQIKVSNIKNIPHVFKEILDITDYEIINSNTIIIKEKIDLNNFYIELLKNNIILYELVEKETNLENYFSKLVGGN